MFWGITQANEEVPYGTQTEESSMADTIIDFEDAKIRAHDHIVRGTAADGQLRAFAITGRETVQAASDHHHTSNVVTAALGRLMMAAQMIGA